MRTWRFLMVIGMIGIPATGFAEDQTGGALVGRVVDAKTGAMLPARVYVTGPDGTPYLPPRQNGESIFHYDVTRGSREVYASIGAHPFRVELPVGQTTITVERGKAYAPMTRTCEIGEGQTVEEVFRLEQSFDMAERGWYSGDLHVHTPLDRLANMQLAEDLNVAFPITAWATDSESVPANRGGPVPEGGEWVPIDGTHGYWNLNTEYEIFRAPGLEGELGAVMILGHSRPFTLTAPPIKPVIAEARKQNAIIDWDKHCWPWSTMLVPVAGIDTMELSNNHMWRLKPHWTLWGEKPPAWMQCSDDAAGWADYGFQTYYALLNSGFDLRPSAGTANGVHPVPLGHSRVYVHIDGRFSYEAWRDGLMKGHSFATNGPMLLLNVDGHEPGKRVALPAGEDKRVEVNVDAFSVQPLDRIELIVNGRIQKVHQVSHDPAGQPARRERLSMPVELSGSSWIAARCFEVAPPDNVRFAHTGPVYFDDPERRLRPEPRQIQFLVDSVAKQLQRVEGKLPPEAVAEFREALAAYRDLDAGP